VNPALPQDVTNGREGKEMEGKSDGKDEWWEDVCESWRDVEGREAERENDDDWS